jgi:hypothetical protein
MLENILTFGSFKSSVFFILASFLILLKAVSSSILMLSFLFASIGYNVISKQWIFLSKRWTASIFRRCLVFARPDKCGSYCYDKRATQTVHGLQKRFFDLKPTADKGIHAFLSDVNNINDQLCELDVTKAFEEDAIISKVLSSLLPDFFYFNSA